MKKKILKMCKKLTNPKKKKKPKQQINLSIFCKSNNKLENIFQRTDYAQYTIPLIWEIATS